jgi:hypothetical protein
MRETSANEPLKTHRNTSNDIETGVASLFREKQGRYLLTGQAVSGAQVA